MSIDRTAIQPHAPLLASIRRHRKSLIRIKALNDEALCGCGQGGDGRKKPRGRARRTSSARRLRLGLNQYPVARSRTHPDRLGIADGAPRSTVGPAENGLLRRRSAPGGRRCWTARRPSEHSGRACVCSGSGGLAGPRQRRVAGHGGVARIDAGDLHGAGRGRPRRRRTTGRRRGTQGVLHFLPAIDGRFLSGTRRRHAVRLPCRRHDGRLSGTGGRLVASQHRDLVRATARAAAGAPDDRLRLDPLTLSMSPLA